MECFNYRDGISLGLDLSPNCCVISTLSFLREGAEQDYMDDTGQLKRFISDSGGYTALKLAAGSELKAIRMMDHLLSKVGCISDAFLGHTPNNDSVPLMSPKEQCLPCSRGVEL